jgi:hypothetical protein
MNLTWLKFVAAGLVAALIISRTAAKSREKGFGNLGLVTGLALGLSASPVLAATISAVFTLVGVLAPIYLRSAEGTPKMEESTPSPEYRWLRPLASWLTVGLLVGVFLRVNDVFNFSDNLRSHYRAQGFNDQQVDTLMFERASRRADELLEREKKQEKTNLQSAERAERMSKILADLIRSGDTAEQNLYRVKGALPKEDIAVVVQLEARGFSATQIIEVLRTLSLSQPKANNP